jgi:hypothetical protein
MLMMMMMMLWMTLGSVMVSIDDDDYDALDDFRFSHGQHCSSRSLRLFSTLPSHLVVPMPALSPVR